MINHGCIIRAEYSAAPSGHWWYYSVAQTAFSPQTSIIKETSVKLLTGRLQLLTRSIMTFYYEFLILEGFIFVKLSSGREKRFKIYDIITM